LLWEPPLKKHIPKSLRTVWAVFVVAVVIAVIFANLKRLGLRYDSLDYPFYAQFSARFLASCWRRFSFYPRYPSFTTGRQAKSVLQL